jgi:DNA-binding transcriptional LysR family regulator
MNALAPSVALSAIHVDRGVLETELAHGRVDAALDVWLPLSDHVKRTPLLEERLVVVARRGHPAIAGSIDLETYLKLEHILVSARPTGPGYEDIELSRHSLNRRVRLRCRHFFAGCRIVSQTDFVLTMSEHYARIANEQFGNQILPFPLKVPIVHTYLYWHANSEKDPANVWLRDQILHVLE